MRSPLSSDNNTAMTRKVHWASDGIAWGDICRASLHGNDALFYMVATASFIEITSDLYTRNLVKHFAGDDEVCDWLQFGWESEELTHGQSLREYVRHAWPDFEWEAQYASFLADFSAVCQPGRLLPERSLELVSRCVIEAGTAGYYYALHQATDEPVLSQLAYHIFEDEVGHYRHFYKYFRHYRQLENTGRVQVLGALWHRLRMIEDEDTYLAVKHIHAARTLAAPYDKAAYQSVVRSVRQLAGRHFPLPMAVNMLLKPLDMAPSAQRMLQPMVERLAKRMLA